MMKAILGSALGGLAAGAVALVASAQGRPATADPWAAQAAQTPQAMTIANVPTGSAATTNAPTLVQCEPQQDAVTRRSVVAGREVAEVTCVSRMAPAGYVPAGYYQTPYQPASDIVTQPVVRTETPRPRVVRQTVYRDSAARQSDVRSGRSWKKTALVIGGTTAAGAGVGAIAGGKKGALIGAAIGGGGATIYEAIKRK